MVEPSPEARETSQTDATKIQPQDPTDATKIATPRPQLPPDPGTAPTVPTEYRLPLAGKTSPPTVLPSAQDRMAALNARQKAKRRRGFIIGLLAGQLLILAMDLGGKALMKALRNRVKFDAPIPLEAIVFIGMTAGIIFTGLLIFFVLGCQGMGYVFGTKKVGFFTAVGRGIKRSFKAAWAVGLTLGVVGGTAWFMIPREQWKPTAKYLEEKGRKGVQGARDWVEKIVKPPPSPETK